MQKALAQLLQMQKGKNSDADLDSNGTKTPEAVMETDEKDTDKIDESVDVEEIEEVTKKVLRIMPHGTTTLNCCHFSRAALTPENGL